MDYSSRTRGIPQILAAASDVEIVGTWSRAEGWERSYGRAAQSTWPPTFGASGADLQKEESGAVIRWVGRCVDGGGWWG